MGMRTGTEIEMETGMKVEDGDRNSDTGREEMEVAAIMGAGIG